MRQRTYYVYILSNKRKNVLYTGITGNLQGRVYEHKDKLLEGFTSRYNVDRLVYYEEFGDVYEAIAREKQIKNWHRQWKLDLIKKRNPTFVDLSAEWY